MAEIAYELQINGAPAPREVMQAIVHLEVEDHARMADMARLRLAIGVREDGTGWTGLDDGLFERLTRLDVAVVIGTRREPLIEAYVIETSAELSTEPAESELSVVAMDPTVKMDLEEKVRRWPDMPDSAVATAIFGEHNLAPIVDSTTGAHSEMDQALIQRGTDIQFLRELARRNGFECFVESNPVTGKGEGHFHAPRPDGAPQGVLMVNMGERTNVDSFSTRYDMLRPVEVQARVVETSAPTGLSATADRPRMRPMGKQPTTQAGQTRKILLDRTGAGNVGFLQVEAEAAVAESAFAITAEGELHTVAYGGLLRAKRPVEVAGAGKQFSGVYYVDRVSHVFSNARYTQRFSLRRNAVGL